jgi:hypothetical protein
MGTRKILDEMMTNEYDETKNENGYKRNYWKNLLSPPNNT